MHEPNLPKIHSRVSKSKTLLKHVVSHGLFSYFLQLKSPCGRTTKVVKRLSDFGVGKDGS